MENSHGRTHRSARAANHTSRRRLLAAGLLAVATSLAAAPVAATRPASPASGPEQAPPTGVPVPVEPTVQATVEASGKADFFVNLRATADLSKAAEITDWTARGQFVVDALQKTADRSQAGVRRALAAQGLEFTSYWITNAIKVEAGTAATLDALTARSEVESISAPRTFALPEPAESDPGKVVQAVEWGIAEIGADQVWNTFGVRGEGVVVANIDSGVQFDHPALVGAYRGNEGGGVFDHNYNWFDPSEVCDSPSLAPCDNNGHGSHTMGTMIGDDGAGNQIGVAPEARWIAAKGCEEFSCSDTALLASGQWVLAPTDLAGNNPDPSLRPHIVNNSWGSDDGSDTWYTDTVAAWRAAGLFPVFSNGNAGPSCGSVGSPASYAESYGVGNYTQSGPINGGSSRGPSPISGVGVKPDISAPGTNVRSSVPGDGYANFTGTSMAAPHVSGVIALMWSSAPGLIGDIDATISLLDETARDAPDDQCGGEPGDNNVYGEGKIDALAAVEASPRGPTGIVAGTVTDAVTGDPIAGADVRVGERELSTDDDGTFSIIVPVGTYDVTASAYGYAAATVSVEVLEGETVTADLALEPLPTTVVSGTVTDGGGHGWPLYARVEIDPYPGGAVFTDADTGEWSVELPDGGTYELTVSAEVPGYEPATITITLPGEETVDVALEPDDTCAAPGYEFDIAGLYELFETGDLPAGWDVVDNAGTGQVWAFDDPGGRGNLTGGDGGFAIVDSDFYGPDGQQDTELITPSIDLTVVDDPVIRFATDYDDLDVELADVDLSIDGGATWTTAWSQTGDLRGPETVEIPIASAAGADDVMVRFHYHVGTFDWWWQIDEVFVGSAAAGVGCAPVPGGLVSGNVLDPVTGAGINNATVTGDGQDGVSTTTFGTPEDPAEPDGYYALFSPATGTQSFTASRSGGYADQTETVEVVEDALVVLDFELGAGLLTVTPPSVETDVELGGITFASVVLRNRGSEPVEFELSERDRGREILGATGAPVRRVAGEFVATAAVGVASAAQTPAATPAEEPWIDLADHPGPIMDAGAATVEGIAYVIGGYTGAATVGDVSAFDPAAAGWVERAPMPTARSRPAVAALDGVVYAAGGWGESDATDAFEAYDPASDTWTELAPMPQARGAGAAAVADGQFYVIGGCDPFECASVPEVHRYDPAAGEWMEVAPYPIPISWQSCGTLEGSIVCAGGIAGGGTTTTDGYRYDPAADTWEPIADLPQDAWAAGYTAANGLLLVSGGITDGFATVTNEGFAYDPATDTWTPIAASNNVVYRGASTCGFYKVGGSTGGFSPIAAAEQLPEQPCDEGASDVPWLGVDPTSGTLAAGASRLVTLTLDASVPEVDQPGTYSAELIVKEDTPYAVPPVPITLTVTPPDSYGKLTGTLIGLERCDAEGAPLGGATVLVDGAIVDYELTTAPDGTWKVWLDEANNPVTLTFMKDGWVSETVVADVIATEIVTVDEELRLDAPCAGVEPEVLELTLESGATATAELTLTNMPGAAAYDFAVYESEFALSPQGGREPTFSSPAAIGPTSVRSQELSAGRRRGASINAPPWYGGGDVPGGVVRFAHAACDGAAQTFYVVGGVDGRGLASAKTFRYDAATNSFVELASMPEAGEAPMAVCEGGQIHVIGGDATDRHFVYDVLRDRWSTAAPAPRPVFGAALGAWDGRLYLAGGDADFVPGGTQSRVDVYDIASDTWSLGPAMPAAASNGGWAQVAQYLYVAGGWGDASPGANLAAVHRLDLSTGEWTTGPDLPTARADMALAATDSALYAIGGDDDGGGFFNAVNDATRLAVADWPDGEWADVDPLPAARTANSAGYCTEAIFGTEVWSVGGAGLEGGFLTISGRTWFRAASGELCPTVRGDVPWLSVDPATGSVPADGSTTLTVTVDATELDSGSYAATLIIVTTDPGRPEMRVPVEVDVTGGEFTPVLYMAGAASGPVDGVIIDDEDLVGVAADGSVAMAFDGSDVGVGGLALDAAAVLDDGSWAFSFTQPGAVPGIPGTVDDSDVVLFTPTQLGEDTAGTFASWIDGSDLGLSTQAEDIDAVDVLEDGSVVLSTVGAFQAGALTGQDRDLLRFVASSFGTRTAGTLEIMLDGSDVELDLAAEDLDAVAVTADGSVAVSTLGALSVTGLTAGPADVALFVPTQLGPVTTGTWDPALVFEGGPAGIVQLSAVELA